MVGPIKQLEGNKRSLTNAQQISKDMDQYWKRGERAGKGYRAHTYHALVNRLLNEKQNDAPPKKTPVSTIASESARNNPVSKWPCNLDFNRHW